MMVAEQGPFTNNNNNNNNNYYYYNYCYYYYYYKIIMEKEGLESALVLGDSNLHGFLRRFARRCFGR